MEKKETKKLCKHSINGGCRFGSACNSWHPLNPTAAAAEWSAKGTLNVCGFYPHCTNQSCTYLHIDLQPRGAPPVSVTPPASVAPTAAPSRVPPMGRTPARPAEAPRGARAARAERSRGEPKLPRGETKLPRADKRREAARSHGAAPPIIQTIQAKLGQIREAETSCRASAKTLTGNFATELLKKADQAAEMQVAVITKLTEFSGVLDEYLALLGTTSESPEKTSSGAISSLLVELGDDSPADIAEADEEGAVYDLDAVLAGEDDDDVGVDD
jgi:hypothetical protein